MQRLGFIRQAQKAGFTLEEIASLLEMDRTGDRAKARAMASTRLEALDARIAELSEARPRSLGSPKFVRGGEAGPCPILTAFEYDAAAPLIPQGKQGPLRLRALMLSKVAAAPALSDAAGSSLSSAARRPLTSVAASRCAQKCMKKSRSWSFSMWLCSAVTSSLLVFTES
jgi:DNA-binding transcriptional MerR regulator